MSLLFADYRRRNKIRVKEDFLVLLLLQKLPYDALRIINNGPELRKSRYV